MVFLVRSFPFAPDYSFLREAAKSASAGIPRLILDHAFIHSSRVRWDRSLCPDARAEPYFNPPTSGEVGPEQFSAHERQWPFQSTHLGRGGTAEITSFFF